MKTCKTCQLEKPLSEFYQFTQKGRTKRARPDCKLCYREYIRNRNRANPDLVKHWDLRRYYGITLEDFNTMAKSQNWLCAICDRKKKLSVDHDHKTGVVRKLLCRSCNLGIGLFEESIKRLQRAIHYLVGD